MPIRPILRRFATGRRGSAAVEYGLFAAAVTIVGLGVVGAIGGRTESVFARLERGFANGGGVATRIETVPAHPAPAIAGTPAPVESVSGLGLKR